MNSQQLILDRIATAVGCPPNSRILLLNDGQYGNTGTLRTLDSDTLAQIAAVDYEFSQTGCNFGPFGKRVAAHRYGQPATSAAWVYGSIPELVDAVAAHLRGGS